MQITELAARLQSLGLSDKEAKVYVASLLLGPAPVQKIAEQADINRATAYVILDQLCQMGLVSQSTEGKKTVFVAEPPEALERLFESQQRDIERRRQELTDLMPALQGFQRSDARQAPMVRFYRGKDGVIAISADLRRKARPGTEIYGLVNYDKAVEVFPEFLTVNPKTRLKKKLASKIIYSYQHKTVPSDSKLLRQTARVDRPVKADISLFEDAAALATYAGTDTIGILIESPDIVEALRQLFELAWQNVSSEKVS